jgi:hypothetical protein
MAVRREALARLAAAQERLVGRYPGSDGRRQPVHTVYVGAHEYRAGLERALGEQALAALNAHAPEPDDLAAIFGVPAAVHARVVAKLEREPVEDLRLDFEDGYGVRSDAEEDGHAVSTAAALAAGPRPMATGIRLKSLSAELGERALRTLELFVGALGRPLPGGFVVTLAKITSVDQVAVAVEALEALEAEHGLGAGTLRLELMIETTQCLPILGELLDAARGRCVAAHFGTYDYTTGCDVAAAHQHMRHPACEHAKQAMKVAYAGTGLWLSDGSTNVLPVGDAPAVRAAWRRHADDVRHSLVGGFYQGWDLHPAQLVSRYAAVYGFYLDGLAAATERLAGFLARATQATVAGEVYDDAATGQALLNFFLRGLACGALTPDEVRATGLTAAELEGRSFARLLRARRGG